MAHYVLVRHKCREFREWKFAYDADFPRRSAAGLTQLYLFQSADDPNEVTLLFRAVDLPRAKAMASSPDIKEIMQKAGIVGKPDVYFLKD
jgi:hypothetical protein